jgi:hypothetical protein
MYERRVVGTGKSPPVDVGLGRLLRPDGGMLIDRRGDG